MHPDE
jgi:hypothetical protein